MKYVPPVEVYSAVRDGGWFGPERLTVQQYVDGSLSITQRDDRDEDDDRDGDDQLVTMSAAQFAAIAAALGYVRAEVQV